jgi:hypothetical protein
VKHWLVILFIISFNGVLRAQIFGCTDYYATNFDSNANINDGSCVYSFTSRNTSLITKLDSTLNENSALVHYNGKLFTINDSGNSNDVLEIDSTTGAIVKRIKVKNASNVDWEALAVSTKYLYIADFGNNIGNRTNLIIYRVPIDSLADGVHAEFIYFALADQTIFTPNAKTNFDMEALLQLNDTLYIFTKQWGNLQTKQYMLPTWKNNDTAVLVDSFNTACLITDASINADGKIALLGYDTSGQSYVWLFSNYSSNKFFSGNKRKINLGFSAGQAEGIHLQNSGDALITCEAFSIFPANLFRLQLSDLWPALTSLDNISTSEHAYFYNNILHFPNHQKVRRIELYDNMGRMVQIHSFPKQNQLNVEHATFVKVFYNDGKVQILRK